MPDQFKVIYAMPNAMPDPKNPKCMDLETILNHRVPEGYEIHSITQAPVALPGSSPRIGMAVILKLKGNVKNKGGRPSRPEADQAGS